MDELLLENSLFTNQSEYDDIIKDKEKVADIFFINYFGFFSLFKLGLRGDIKRYKSEEASLYPKYIGADNKDVSLSVKMLFDAKMTHGSVTARMTKLLAKVKGNMLEPKDIDNLALKDILNDSKITTANKPSMKVRQIMQQWIDDEFAIEWVAYYLYKIARLPEYKDITKEFVSMYKTGQYAQAYTNILNGARKKHTGDIPKEFQNNNPTQLANTPTDNAVDSLSDKEKFLSVFKQAIEAEKNKIVQGVGDVPVKNNSDYTEDKLPEPKQESPEPPPVETVELGLVELTKETIKVNNGGDIEFIKPTNKNFVFNGEEIDSYVGFGYIETIIDLVTDGFRNAGVTPFVPNFDNIIYKFEIAVYAMFKEYDIKLQNREAVSLPRSIIIRNLIRDRVIGQTGDYLYPKEYDSYRSHVLSSVDAKDVSSKYTYQISTAKYGLKVIERVLSGEIELDHDLLRGTFHILCGLASDDSIAYSSDSNTTLKSILNRFLNNGEQELTDDEVTEQLVGMIVRGLFDKVTNIQKIDQIGLLELMQEIGMYDTVIDQDTGITHYVLNTDFYTIFSKLDDVKKYLDVGYVEIDNFSHFHLLRKTIPQPTMITNPFIDAIVGDNGINDSGYKFVQEFNELAQNDWITTATPNGIDNSEYTHNNIQGLYLKIKEKSIGHFNQILSHFRSFYQSMHKPTMSFLKTMNDKAQAIYSIETMLAMEHFSLDFDTRFAPKYSDLSSSDLDNMVCLALACSHFYTNGKFPKHPFYDDFIKKLGERLASYISKQMYDEFEAVAKDYNPYRLDHGSTLTQRTVKILLGELTKYFPDINDKVKDVFFTNKQDIQKFIGVTTYTIPRIKSDEKAEDGIYALTISDDIYQIAVEQVLSGEISLVDVHESISIKMLKDGKLTKEMTDQYMKELYARLQSYNPYSDHGHHDKFRGESMELLGIMVQTGADFDQTLFNEIINLYSSEFMMNSEKYIDSMNGTSPSSNVPFVRMMLDPTLNVAINENTDKIAELIFESILRRFSIGRGDTSV